MAYLNEALTVTGTTTLGVVSASGLATLSSGVAGNTSASAAAAGVVGETIEISRLFASAISETSATTTNVTASPLTLTQGWWRISGCVAHSPAATTSITNVQGGVSLTSATIPAASTLAVPSSAGEIRLTFGFGAMVPGNQNDILLPIPTYEVYVSTSTNFYLFARSTFTVSTMSIYGWLRAVRFR